MKIIEASFLKSVMDPEHYPRDGRPEFAFVGRSNVGKSSLLNTLLGRKGLAKTSGTPGKTQTVNFFDINGKIYFVDLPGYGYAKVPKTVQQQWAAVMTSYLRDREPLRLVVQLVDARHTPTEKDADMLRLLDESEKPTLVVATKIDKLKRSARFPALATIREKLDLPVDALVVPFSAVTREGAKEIWEILDGLT
jgi:GTP-binding protein